MIHRAAMCDVADINKWVERDCGQPVDFADFIKNPLNVGLIEAEGGALFVWRGPGIYEVHVFFSQRGREVLDLSHRMLAMMRDHGAKLFWAAIPDAEEFRRVRMFTRLMGWKSQGFSEQPHGRCELFLGE